MSVSLTFDVEKEVGAEIGAPNILGLLEEYDMKATFFVVAELALEYPSLMSWIVEAGHELACHGYTHVPHSSFPEWVLREELRKAVTTLREFGEVVGFRAPSFCEDTNIYSVLREHGILYDTFWVGTSSRPLVTPLRLRTPTGVLSIVPTQIETYNREVGLEEIEALALLDGVTTLLFHPFYDGLRPQYAKFESLVNAISLCKSIRVVRLRDAVVGQQKIEDVRVGVVIDEQYRRDLWKKYSKRKLTKAVALPYDERVWQKYEELRETTNVECLLSSDVQKLGRHYHGLYYPETNARKDFFTMLGARLRGRL